MNEHVVDSRYSKGTSKPCNCAAILVQQGMCRLRLKLRHCCNAVLTLIVQISDASLWLAGLVGGKSSDQQQQSLQDRPVDGTSWCAALCGSVGSLSTKQLAAA